MPSGNLLAETIDFQRIPLAERPCIAWIGSSKIIDRGGILKVFQLCMFRSGIVEDLYFKPGNRLSLVLTMMVTVRWNTNVDTAVSPF